MPSPLMTWKNFRQLPPSGQRKAAEEILRRLLHIPGAARILTGLVMGIMFVIFLWIGIRSFGQIKQLKDATATEDALQDEILKWFLDTYRADVIDQSVDNDQPEEALYFSRYEVMEKLLLHQYPSLSESFTDHMIELLYAELF